MSYTSTLFASFIAIVVSACSFGNIKSAGTEGNNADSVAAATKHPAFNQDSAYRFIERQVSFGHRIPGTEAHRKCVRYFVEKLTEFGADSVWIQCGEMRAHGGDIVPIQNVLARIGEDKSKRILLVAHYDTRPWADNEKQPSQRNMPIAGANDGGSGVGVILELTRIAQMLPPEVGMDILLTDAEDMGTNEGFGNDEMSWCLGTQYWAQSDVYKDAPKPSYGIVLDMVGGRDAKFHREYNSNILAGEVVNKIWSTAANTSYADRFPNQTGGSLVDDHIFINQTGIPCVDIVESMNPQTHGFPPTWHTLSDNLDHIDRSTLKAVGEVLLDVIYSEKHP